MFLRNRLKVTCFFCNETLPTRPTNPRAFQCPSCDCWNRYDNNGELLSDEPAMHEESLNTASYSKRASPHKDRLPSTFRNSIFCRTCQTNQTLYINLLSNYLPDEDDPIYSSLLAQLPDYQASLAARYPPVCPDCSGGVEEEIRKSERVARANALGSWLKDGRRTRHAQEGIALSAAKTKWALDIVMWRIRGALWVSTLLLSTGGSIMCWFRSYEAQNQRVPFYALPAFSFLSIFWSFWDPIWSRLRDSHLRDSPSRVAGRQAWIRHQAIAWALRFFTSCLIACVRIPIWWYPLHLAVEFMVLALSISALRTVRSPSVRLAPSGAPRSGTPYPTTIVATASKAPSFTPPPQPDDLFSTLTLSSRPALHQSRSTPVFGEISPIRSTTTFATSEAPPEGDMDWAPTSRGNLPLESSGSIGDGSWLRPQRFFAPSEPTGLENLFENTKIQDPTEERGRGSLQRDVQIVAGNGRRRSGVDSTSLYLVALLVAVLLASALLLRVGSWKVLHEFYASPIPRGPYSVPNHSLQNDDHGSYPI